jgi:hypothetical protein
MGAFIIDQVYRQLCAETTRDSAETSPLTRSWMICAVRAAQTIQDWPDPRHATCPLCRESRGRRARVARLVDFFLIGSGGQCTIVIAKRRPARLADDTGRLAPGLTLVRCMERGGFGVNVVELEEELVRRGVNPRDFRINKPPDESTWVLKKQGKVWSAWFVRAFQALENLLFVRPRTGPSSATTVTVVSIMTDPSATIRAATRSLRRVSPRAISADEERKRRRLISTLVGGDRKNRLPLGILGSCVLTLGPSFLDGHTCPVGPCPKVCCLLQPLMRKASTSRRATGPVLVAGISAQRRRA